jgi:hypothetical protein
VFKSEGQKKLEALIEDLASAYLLGDENNSPEGREQICTRLTGLAQRLRAEGDEKAVVKARSYRSRIRIAFPPVIQHEMDEMVAESLA